MPITLVARLAIRAQRRSRRNAPRTSSGGEQELRSKYEEIANRAEELAIRRMRSAANRLIRQAQRNAPVVTGRLRNSIRITRQTSSVVRIEATAEYAKYVEFGTARFEGRYFMRRAARQVRGLLRGTLRVRSGGQSVSLKWKDIIRIEYSRSTANNPRIDLILDPVAIDRVVEQVADQAIENFLANFFRP